MSINERTEDIKLFTALRILSQHGDPGTLFPKLEKLFWKCCSTRYRQANRHAQSFFGNRLRLFVLHDDIPQDPSVLEPALDSLPSLSPYIKELQLSLVPSSNLVAVLRKLPQLSHLYLESFGPVTNEVLNGICTLPCLESLDMACPLATDPCNLRNQPNQSIFPRLKKLRFSPNPLASTDPYNLLLRNFPPTHLEELEIQYGSPNYSLFTLLQTISDTVSHDTLTQLTLAAIGWELEAINLDTLRPLLAFRNLERLDLRFVPQTDLDNNSFQVLASSWPQLSYFKLSAKYGASGSAATIESLATLVRYSPRLQYMEFNFNPSSLVSALPPHQQGSSFSNLLIRTLYVYSYRQMNPTLVAAYLSDLFPNLAEIQVIDKYEANRWDEVERALPAARERENMCNASNSPEVRSETETDSGQSRIRNSRERRSERRRLFR